MHNTEEKNETAVLVAVQTQKQTAEQTKEYLDELAFLADTSKIDTLQTFTQKLEKRMMRILLSMFRIGIPFTGFGRD